MHPDHIGGLLSFLFYRKLHNIKSPLTLIGPMDMKIYLADCFQHTQIDPNKKMDWINISANYELTLEDDIVLSALEMEHKILCWGYRLKDSNKILAFITDTLPCSNAVKLAKEADVLIHEATFRHHDRDKAVEHFHTTEIQAMEIADEAKVKRLVLTHFSPRLTDKEIKEWNWQRKPCVVFDERQDI